jgi:hypothetical protein
LTLEFDVEYILNLAVPKVETLWVVFAVRIERWICKSVRRLATKM